MEIKKLEELGISPTPWTLGTLIMDSDGLVTRSSVDDANGDIVAGDIFIKDKDAYLIAAAPELYDCMREAVAEACSYCQEYEIAKCRGKCYVAKWRDAIAKAAGDSEVK